VQRDSYVFDEDGTVGRKLYVFGIIVGIVVLEYLHRAL
jgi:hypothetical protein